MPSLRPNETILAFSRFTLSRRAAAARRAMVLEVELGARGARTADQARRGARPACRPGRAWATRLAWS